MATTRKKVGVVMDPIGAINFKKDTTLAFLLEAQSRGHDLHYMEMPDLRIRDGVAEATTHLLSVKDDPQRWHEFGERLTVRLGELDMILMRKDPPFDMEYVYATYVLELAEQQGASVVNRPASLRDVNEKLFIQQFPECCAPTLVTRAVDPVRDFLEQHGKVVVKPLDGMGGKSVFVLQQGDSNLSVILETVTEHQTRTIMAQKYIPEIVDGDKRILLIDGEPVPYALARVPLAGESRGNLAAGGKARGIELNDRDRWICEQVKDSVRDRGLWFVGLDVIGEYLTEVNVTSPTCVRELDAIYGLNISAQLFDALERRLSS